MRAHKKPPPSTKENISAWVNFFNIRMPEDLEALLLETDGPVLYDDETGKEIQFLSTKDATEYFDAYDFETFCSDAIPIAMDGCGNFVAYKRNDLKISGIFGMPSRSMGWEDAVRLCDSIAELIEMEDLIEDRIYR